MSAYEVVLLDRVRELIGYRGWIKLLLNTSPDRAPYWKPLDAEYRAELLALVRLARKARRLEATAPDPIDEFKGWREVAPETELERAAARG